MNQDEIKNNLLSADTWVRILFMALYALAAWAVGLLLIIMVVIQALVVLVSGRANWNLQRSGYLFGRYLQEIIQFLLYNTETKPFPFGSDFPSDAGFDIPEPVAPSAAAAPEPQQQAAQPEPAADSSPGAPAAEQPASQDAGNQDYRPPSQDHNPQ